MKIVIMAAMLQGASCILRQALIAISNNRVLSDRMDFRDKLKYGNLLQVEFMDNNYTKFKLYKSNNKYLKIVDKMFEFDDNTMGTLWNLGKEKSLSFMFDSAGNFICEERGLAVLKKPQSGIPDECKFELRFDETMANLNEYTRILDTHSDELGYLSRHYHLKIDDLHHRSSPLNDKKKDNQAVQEASEINDRKKDARKAAYNDNEYSQKAPERTSRKENDRTLDNDEIEDIQDIQKAPERDTRKKKERNLDNNDNEDIQDVEEGPKRISRKKKEGNTDNNDNEDIQDVEEGPKRTSRKKKERNLDNNDNEDIQDVEEGPKRTSRKKKEGNTDNNDNEDMRKASKRDTVNQNRDGQKNKKRKYNDKQDKRDIEDYTFNTNEKSHKRDENYSIKENKSDANSDSQLGAIKIARRSGNSDNPFKGELRNKLLNAVDEIISEISTSSGRGTETNQPLSDDSN